MGNASSNQKEDLCTNRHSYYAKLLSAPPLWSTQTSYSKWAKQYKNVEGFTDFADFTTCREARKRHGILVKPDTYDGRQLVSQLKSKSELTLIEKQKWKLSSFKLPRIPLTGLEDPYWLHSRHNRNRRECSIVGYHDTMAVLQINTNRYHLSPRFYILDLENKQVLGHFVVFYHCKRWYECYISPNKHQLLIRPDNLTRIVSLPDNYMIENISLMPHASKLRINAVPPTLRAHVLAFNSQAGDNFVLTAFYKEVELRSIGDWNVVRKSGTFRLPASIQQIKSSPLGDYIVVRCVHPLYNKEYRTNIVAVISYVNFELLLRIDVRGCYWPASEVINLQVFPYFSPSEATIAVMKNHAYNRKVITQKLPIVRLNLQYLCRRAILHLVSYRDVGKLPLPAQLVDYIQGKPHKICNV